MKEFVEEISRRLGLGKDLIETDILLHRILLDLSKTDFAGEVTFKGGSCLIKHYLGYYRFSVDLDFTFLDQSVFEGLSQKGVRRLLSGKIDVVGGLFEEVSAARGLDFRCNKSDRKYVELGGGNKFATFKLRYPSILGAQTFVKIQLNFVEKILFPTKRVNLKSICPESEELRFLFPEHYGEYSASIPFNVYDVREILCEKVRAVLTRRGFKERDFIDVYLISRRFKINLEEVEKEVAEKTRFILSFYRKYRKNLSEKISLLNVENFPFGSERHLLIEEIDEKEFYSFLEDFMSWLKKLAKNFI